MNTKPAETADQIRERLVRSVSELIDADNQAFYEWQSEHVSSMGYSRSRERQERYSRVYDAAENGADGSTHAENISDFQDYCDNYFSEINRAAWRLDLDSQGADSLQDEIDGAQEAVEADIQALWQWHDKNGSLYQQVG